MKQVRTQLGQALGSYASNFSPCQLVQQALHGDFNSGAGLPRQLSSLACSTSEPRHTPCSSGSSPSSRASGRYGATVLPSSRQLGFSTSPSPQRLSQPSSFLRSSRDCLASISIATCHNAIDNAKYNPPQSWCRRFHATTILSSQYDCTDQASLVKSLRKRGDIQSNSVEQVMLQVDRRDFAHTHLGMPAHVCYRDEQLAIGYGQSIPAPSLHAITLELMAAAGHLQPGARVLDVGAGSGYLTACVGLLVGASGRVVGVERGPGLAAQARDALRKLMLSREALGLGPTRTESQYADPPLRPNEDFIGNVRLVQGNALEPATLAGHQLFDVVHVGASARAVPADLLALLRPGGRLIIPLGPPAALQVLTVVDKQADGSVVSSQEREVKVTPLVPPGADKP